MQRQQSFEGSHRRKVISVGPFGSNSNKERGLWDDGVYSTVSQVVIQFDLSSIRWIQFEYVDENGRSVWSERHGLSVPAVTKKHVVKFRLYHRSISHFWESYACHQQKIISLAWLSMACSMILRFKLLFYKSFITWYLQQTKITSNIINCPQTNGSSILNKNDSWSRKNTSNLINLFIDYLYKMSSNRN